MDYGNRTNTEPNFASPKLSNGRGNLDAYSGKGGPSSPTGSRARRLSSCSGGPAGNRSAVSTSGMKASPLNDNEDTISKVELMSIKGKAAALHWSMETGWELLGQIHKDTLASMSRALKTSLILRASLDVIGVSSCLCVHAYTSPLLSYQDSLISRNKVEEGWVRIPLFVPFVSLKHADDAEERLKLLVRSLCEVSETTEEETASRLDLIGLKQKDLRTYDLLFKAYAKLYLGRIQMNVDMELLHRNDIIV